MGGVRLMRAAVTGASGFIGGHLAAALAARGAEVRPVTRETSDVSGLRSLGLEPFIANLQDPDALEMAFKGCDVVFHLAATTSRTAISRQHCAETNVAGTLNVAAAARRSGVGRLVYGSTAAVYGVVSEPPVTEESRTQRNSPYAETKALSEDLLREEARRHGLPVVLARYPGVFGRGAPSWTGLFGAIGTGRFRLIGHGRNRTHTIHVSDLVDGLLLCASSGDAAGKTYNLAGAEPIAVADFVDMIARELAVERRAGSLPVWPYRLHHLCNGLAYRFLRRELPRAGKYELFISDKVMSIDRARRELGYAPQCSVLDGVRDTLAWYREMGQFIPTGARTADAAV